MMKKIINLFFAFSFSFLLLSSVSIVYAQGPLGVGMPGLTCGMAGAGNNIDSCCVDTSNNNVNINSYLPPGMNSYGASSNKQIQDLNTWQKSAFKPCIYGDPETSTGVCKCVLSNKIPPIPAVDALCKLYLKNADQTICSNCARGGGLWTGIGCVPLEIKSFITDYLMNVAIGFAGVIALFCIIYSAFMMQTSQGNPEKIKKAQGNLTACVSGLLLIIFSIFILRLIGVDILRIPGFGK